MATASSSGLDSSGTGVFEQAKQYLGRSQIACLLPVEVSHKPPIAWPSSFLSGSAALVSGSIGESCERMELRIVLPAGTWKTSIESSNLESMADEAALCIPPGNLACRLLQLLPESRVAESGQSSGAAASQSSTSSTTSVDDSSGPRLIVPVNRSYPTEIRCGKRELDPASTIASLPLLLGVSGGRSSPVRSRSPRKTLAGVSPKRPSPAKRARIDGSSLGTARGGISPATSAGGKSAAIRVPNLGSSGTALPLSGSSGSATASGGECVVDSPGSLLAPAVSGGGSSGGAGQLLGSGASTATATSSSVSTSGASRPEVIRLNKGRKSKKGRKRF